MRSKNEVDMENARLALEKSDLDKGFIDEPAQLESEKTITFEPLGMRRLARLDKLNEENRNRRRAMGFRNRAHERLHKIHPHRSKRHRIIRVAKG